jgi:hypothetical protein
MSSVETGRTTLGDVAPGVLVTAASAGVAAWGLLTVHFLAASGGLLIWIFVGFLPTSFPEFYPDLAYPMWISTVVSVAFVAFAVHGL